ncbi:hypothetical protein WA577_001261 [Blastocystis sp. JDR]
MKADDCTMDMEDADYHGTKYSHGKRGVCSRYFSFCQITVAILVWYLSSILATVVNKKLISGKEHVFPLTLTFAHVFISSLCDILNMCMFHRRELKFYSKNLNLWLIIRYISPLAIAMISTKLLTYVSYGYIPVSLTHTVKALQPFFNVLIVFVWTGEGVDKKTLLSLIPIVFGVAYASFTELEFNMVGFMSALVSTVVGVWQSVYLKMLMRMGLEKNFLHWCNGTFSWILLMPIVLYYEYRVGSWRNINFKHLIISSLVQYLSSIASYYTMSLVTSLSYSIASTLKRVSIIISSVLYFGKSITLSNLFGIAVASFGAVLYNIQSKKTNRRRVSPQLKANRELSYTDLSTITI